MSEAGALHAHDLVPGPATPGMNRRTAYAGEDRWIGHVTTEPGVFSGWHHHGQHDTYFYVISGAAQIEVAEGRTFEVLAGDFAHIPAGTIHREGTFGADPLEAIVIRFGTGPQVFDVPDPDEEETT
jgi:mannose-6-phosphate isomerase-like protein (cupin superfamily)